MLIAYAQNGPGLIRLAHDAPLDTAVWIDLFRPLPPQIAQMADLGVAVPSLDDMEEIEISNRLYREDHADFMTAVLPGATPEGGQISAPITFILTETRLITVRHHAPRPFETFADRAERSTVGCGDSTRLFLGLVEEIVARQADLLEAAGRALDHVSVRVLDGGSPALHAVLLDVAREAEVLNRVRLGLLTVERMLSVFGVWHDGRTEHAGLRGHLRAMVRDINALEVHADFLSGRVSLTTDTTLGMINLEQNKTVRIVSVVAALFLPPTLIASIYGMNFAVMPELAQVWGYPAALVLMAASALVTYWYFRWKKWL